MFRLAMDNRAEKFVFVPLCWVFTGGINHHLE